MNELDQTIPLEAWLPEVTGIAHQAGAAIMAVYRNGFTVTGKEDCSPLTEADWQSHQLIVRALGELTPALPVLSEEAANIPYAERGKWQRFWLVDPLDGTKEFIKRNGEFTVNIALIENGQPVLGVVHVPALGRSYWAARGRGAFRADTDGHARPIAVRQRAFNELLKVVASRSHADPRQESLLAGLGKHECVSMGSSLKLCLVAEGVAHIYPRLGPTMEWDTAAAHAIVDEAGGRVCDFTGNELRYNKNNLLNPPFVVLAKRDADLLESIKKYA